MAQKRSIFEEVGEKGAGLAPPAPKGGMIAQDTGRARGLIRAWLAVLFALVVVMIAVGGLTRLTDSGLSITEWEPISGAIPPLSDADWMAEFEKYQAIPEYKLQNTNMTLEEFKVIFWWEWGHRQLGRLIGLVWAIGFLPHLIARVIGSNPDRIKWHGFGEKIARSLGSSIPGWTMRFLLLGVLIGTQGAIGWWMVSSGLDGYRVDVASYRLATHLGLAFVILGFIAWYRMLLGRSDVALLQARRAGEGALASLSTGLMHLAFLQILLGALVAGIDAGRAFPTWPDMNGQFFPADAFYVVDRDGNALPLWHAFFENPGLVQFMHRMTGYLLFAFGIFAWVRARGSAYGATRAAFGFVALMMVAQMGLGIMAALTAAQLHVALAHQFGAVVLWVLILRARYLARYPLQGSIREGTI